MAAEQHIIHCIPSLAIGGAERLLERLLRQPSMARFCHQIVVLTHKQPSVTIPAAIPVSTWWQWLAARRAHQAQLAGGCVVHGHTYLGNSLASMVARLCPTTKVLWTIHNEGPMCHAFSYKTLLAAQLQLAWQHKIHQLIYVAWQSASCHRAAGLAHLPSTVIPIGVEPVTSAKPTAAQVSAHRLAMALPAEGPLLLHLARADPIKDHTTLLQAFALLHQGQLPAALRPHLLLVGPQQSMWPRLRSQLPAALQGWLHLAPMQSAIEQLWACRPIVCLASKSEACPTVLLEARANGCWAVATAVGDIPYLLRDGGFTAPSQQPFALARALATCILYTQQHPQPPPPLPEQFAMTSVSARYATLYEQAFAKLAAHE